MAKLRLLPSESRRRGLPAMLGLDLVIADGVVTQSTPPGVVAVLSERRSDGKPVGTMTIEIVAAKLIIDRDGTLATLAMRRSPTAVPYPVELDAGASGFRADIVCGDQPELPYHSWLALAPLAAVVGGGAVIVSIESATPEWPAAIAMLATLRVFSRDGDARAPTADTGASLALPLVKPSGS
jgi:hypothetical protein